MSAALRHGVLVAWALVAGLQADPARAAGFDCGKAVTRVEQTICQDAALSRMDEQLGAAYRTAAMRCPDADLKAEQQRWLRAVRDVCGDAACLAAAYRKRLTELQDRRCASDACAGFGPRLVGAWRRVSEAGSIEQIAFRGGQGGSQGRFDTWLHQRPEFVDGRWQLRACELRLLPAGEPDSRATTLSVLAVSDKELKLRDPDEAGPALYRRVRP